MDTHTVCQCEHIKHFDLGAHGNHGYLSAPAGSRKAIYLGPVCDQCAATCVADYLVKASYVTDVEAAWDMALAEYAERHPTEYNRFVVAVLRERAIKSGLINLDEGRVTDIDAAHGVALKMNAEKAREAHWLNATNPDTSISGGLAYEQSHVALVEAIGAAYPDIEPERVMHAGVYDGESVAHSVRVAHEWLGGESDSTPGPDDDMGDELNLLIMDAGGAWYVGGVDNLAGNIENAQYEEDLRPVSVALLIPHVPMVPCTMSTRRLHVARDEKDGYVTDSYHVVEVTRTDTGEVIARHGYRIDLLS